MKSLVNRTVYINDKEKGILSRATKKVVKSVFEREYRPVRLRILLDSIGNWVDSEAVFASTIEEMSVLNSKNSNKVKKRSSKK